MSSVPPPGAPRPLVAPADAAGVPPAWRAWMAPTAFLVAFALGIVAQVVVVLIGSIFGSSVQDPTPAVMIVSTVTLDAAFVGSAIGFAQTAGRPTPAQFGLRPTALRPAIGWMALAFALYYAFAGLWVQLLHVTEKDKLPSSLGVEQSTIALVAVCVFVTVLAPIAEEFFFRGFFFTALRGWRGPWVAAVATGLTFGAVHLGSAPVPYLAPLAMLGFLLCIVRWKTGSLVPCIVVHAINNALAFGVGQVHWNAVQVLLLLCGAVAAVLLLTYPFLVGGRAARRLV
jgi:membrane protease YdiL (CAAX protease family)